MHAMRVDHLPHTMAVPVAMVRSPVHESGTPDTAEIAGLTPDDQRLFTPPAQVTPMTCKKSVFACLDTDVTFTSISNSPRIELRIAERRWAGRLRGTVRAGNARGAKTEGADCPHVRRYLKPTFTPPSHIK